MSNRVPLALALALITALPALADSTKFSDFEPLTSSAGPLPVDGPGEATPITLANPKWSQETIADRRTQNNSGDELQLRRLGHDHVERDRSRLRAVTCSCPSKRDTAGVQRVDLQNPHYDQRTVTIVAPGTGGFVVG